MASADEDAYRNTDPDVGGDAVASEQDYDLGQPAKEVYDILSTSGRREQVLQMARELSEITITSTMPPQGYHTGDNIPGNNQSVGAISVSTLASKLMFMAFPPGQPIMRLDPVEQKLQKQIDQDPDLYAQVQLALSRLEVAHRKKFATIGLATAWVGLQELLLVAGNGLWKHINLAQPTFHKPDCYVVSRDSGGHPILTIHHERVRVSTLAKDVQALLMEEDDKLAKCPEWQREADIFSVCRLMRNGHKPKDANEQWSWQYWQETCEGTIIPDSEVETDYDDAPMWPCWLIPSYGENWGRSYCEKYRGDLYLVESGHSALNDGLALAAWCLTFVKPGTRTSLRTVQKAKNLDILSGSAEDMSVFNSGKTGDLSWGSSHIQRAEQRLGVAFLSQAAARRDGERVTADEVQRTGAELDQAMGGLYTQSSQGNQRRMIMRAIKLHEEASDDMPKLPPGIVDVQVVTGVDAMGRSVEVQALLDFVKALTEAFPQKVQEIIDASDFSTRLAAGMGIKPDGLVNTKEQIAATQQAQMQQQQGAEMSAKAAGPVGGAVAKGLMDRANAPAAPQPPQQGASDNGQQ